MREHVTINPDTLKDDDVTEAFNFWIWVLVSTNVALVVFKGARSFTDLSMIGNNFPQEMEYCMFNPFGCLTVVRSW